MLQSHIGTGTVQLVVLVTCTLVLSQTKNLLVSITSTVQCTAVHAYRISDIIIFTNKRDDLGLGFSSANTLTLRLNFAYLFL